jgi:hypothetical protein
MWIKNFEIRIMNFYKRIYNIRRCFKKKLREKKAKEDQILEKMKQGVKALHDKMILNVKKFQKISKKDALKE